MPPKFPGLPCSRGGACVGDEQFFDGIKSGKYNDYSVTARKWLDGSFAGHCGATTTGRVGDCFEGDSGNLGLPLTDQGNWSIAINKCVLLCFACKRCRYVSLSLKWADCSWYHECALSQLHSEPPMGPLFLSVARGV